MLRKLGYEFLARMLSSQNTSIHKKYFKIGHF